MAPKMCSSTPQESSIDSTNVDLEAVTALADEVGELRRENKKLRDEVAELRREDEELRDEVESLREETVSTVVVKRVLLEYGISGEQLEGIIEDIEAVDSQLWGEDDE
jgi:FtsZ-binding cell division protein ZapB